MSDVSVLIYHHFSLRLYHCNLTLESCRVLSSVLSSNLELKELDLNENNLQDSGLKLLCEGLKNPGGKARKLRNNTHPVLIQCHFPPRLWDCNLTEECCRVLSSALSSEFLKKLDLSHNKLKDSGVKLLSAGLKSPCCKLEKLGMVSCGITEEDCVALDSALRSNPSSHLKELYLDGNDPGNSGVRLLSERVDTVNWKKHSN
ncbi:hypothetical protein QTP86_020815 [Hemibagrus guttatus]|nr:hypothetical protein QTP86_020815 [Hemibagrus guttatus]